MPLLLTVMGWNIENFGAAKYARAQGGAELIALIVAVMTHNGVDVAGFSEIRSNLGAAIGAELVQELNGGVGVVGPWAFQQSNQFCKNRWEQYLFVWNTNNVTSYQAFQDSYVNPNAPPPLVGFPRQKKVDRPPYLGYFRTTAAPNRDILIAIMHSPEPGFKLNTRDAARNMATVTEFETDGETCLLMGDFNVKVSVNAGTANSLGQAAFGPLVGLAPDPFTQLLPNDVLSSLIKASSAWPAMILGDCYSQPYDQLFFRTNAVLLTAQNQGMDELIDETMNGNYLEASLTALWGMVAVGGAPANFPTVEDAFVPFRQCVSDHMPVLVEIHG